MHVTKSFTVAAIKSSIADVALTADEASTPFHPASMSPASEVSRFSTAAAT